MTKRQGRLFFILCTLAAAGLFVGMTIQSQTRFSDLTHGEKITPAVISGKHVWHNNNCINCHTLLGECVLRTGFDQDHAAARRTLSAGFSEEPVTTLFGTETSTADAKSASERG